MRHIVALSFRSAAVALFLCAAAFALAQNGPPSTQGKTAEQVKKNIQVLKGLPAQQVDLVMNYFASSLGVKCGFCHVVDSTGWYMEKDDKPTKKTARKMIQMVMDLNAKSFGGRDAVTCFTCHRGSNDPASVITLPVVAHAQQEAPREEAGFPTAEQLLAKYETALGGADAIAKITSRKMTGVSVDGQGKESPLEVVLAAPGKYASKTTMREGMVRAIGFNGTSGWMSSPRGVRDLPPDAVEEMKKEASFYPLARLREHAATMHVTHKDSVNGSLAYCLAAPGAGETELFYFDAESGLLVRQATRTETMIGIIPEQTDYLDYRTVDGVKVPFAMRSAGVDPRDNTTERFTTIEQNTPIDESVFAKPAGKK
jgi:photosynthetic reaction center cytochrome c subunit